MTIQNMTFDQFLFAVILAAQEREDDATSAAVSAADAYAAGLKKLSEASPPSHRMR